MFINKCNIFNVLFKNQIRTILIRLNSTTATINTAKIHELNNVLSKYNLNLAKFTIQTQNRLKIVSLEQLSAIIKNLHDYGIEWQRITEVLETYNDYSILTRDNLRDKYEFFRKLNFKSELTNFIIARNEDIMHKNDVTVQHYHKQLKEYFSNNQLHIILTKSPKLLTNNFDDFQYKFNYLFWLMGIQQDEMCTSFVFNHSIDYIRQRHLFLDRAGLFDKPNKKGETKVENSYFRHIMDTNIDTYLKITTMNKFTVEEYQTFCEYLSREDFTDELLGFNIGNKIQKNIILQVKKGKREKNNEDFDE